MYLIFVQFFEIVPTKTSFTLKCPSCIKALKYFFFPSDYWDFVISRHLRLMMHFRWMKLKAILLVDASVFVSIYYFIAL